jgi:hypothetical protein
MHVTTVQHAIYHTHPHPHTTQQDEEDTVQVGSKGKRKALKAGGGRSHNTRAKKTKAS